MSSNDAKSLQYLGLLDKKLTQTNSRLDALENSLKQLVEVLKEQITGGDANLIDNAVQRHLQPVHTSLFKLKSTTSLIARGLPRPGKKLIRVVFLVHSVETWDALHEVYTLMLQHERFDPIIITLNRDYLNAEQFAQEEINHQGLVQLGIHPYRFMNSDDHANDLEMLKLMNPDIIFRQSPWDISIPSSFHFHELDFAKICYVSYGFGVVNMGGVGQSNLYFMRSCWRAYCETTAHYDAWKYSVSKGNLAVSGSAKLDRIVEGKDNAAWPIAEEADSIRIIWAPHHSLTDDWLFFSTFMSNYLQFLQLARECPNLQIVLKPHPALFNKLVSYGLLKEQELLSYLKEFVALPNTALVTGANYIPMFWGSDIMITDGIGFFAEYMVTEKPIIWTENPGHFPLNEIGLILQNGMYRANVFEDVVAYLEMLCVNKEDPLKEKRLDIIKQIAPHSHGSAKFIVDDILKGMDEE
ncbi:hypothetical protein RGU70_01740 [Herbaspirillum sp. RTI4]|uniref:hypothetical protein n=1 Tax=Herbaspirillum sp. RTI4 TaxID=3048640 RepID=UPI002AB5D05F|nr:hypothetical protein [Herbaspirillum sp. RTI4]MDY7577048.1 hypothetical protein [Herbaspirillum sp. RTI4]MEA9982228.1 hypothetical protein [Herbaspirillum sp. RTI4]